VKEAFLEKKSAPEKAGLDDSPYDHLINNSSN
jgi:hypothetical protein